MPGFSGSNDLDRTQNCQRPDSGDSQVQLERCAWSEASPAVTRLSRRFVARALTLQEHLDLDRKHVTGPLHHERAKLDLGRFLSVRNKPVFDEYLSLTGIDTDAIITALSVDCVGPKALGDAPWSTLLGQVLSTEFIRRSNPEIDGAGGLLKPLYPFLQWADERIGEWRDAYDCDWQRLRPALLARLSDQLSELTYKTFVLEARILCLDSEPTTDRPPDWVSQRFSQTVSGCPRYIQRLYLTYPALSRQLATTLLQWKKNTLELFVRLFRDLASIERDIVQTKLGLLQHVDATLSDPHEDGRRVLILEFAQNKRVVYKPRPVGVDVAFQNFLSWLNLAGIRPALRVLRVVASPDCGWVEFVKSDALPAPELANAFYMRHGIFLAVLYLLKGTDFHSENVIASGEHPVLIDLETLLHADLRFAVEGPSPTTAEAQLRESVFATGLLPGWGDGDPVAPSPDISGIGTREGQLYKNKSDIIEQGSDGTIQIVRRRAAVSLRYNRPTFAGAPINPALYADDVAKGFDACVRLLQENARNLAAPDGPLAPLLQVKVRHVPLATIVYASLQKRASHPDFLGRSVYRELIFAMLAFRSISLPLVGALLKSELAALFRGDVPKFTALADSTSLEDDQGKSIPDVLVKDAATVVSRRLALLNDENAEFQKKVIRLSMATLRRTGEPGAESAPGEPVPEIALAPGEMLEEVREIARTLCDSAVGTGQSLDWIGISQQEYGVGKVSAVGGELYGGVSGIGLFLGYAGKRLQDDRFLDAARSCALASLDYLQGKRGIIGGGYSGRASSAYGILHLAELFGEMAWFEAAAERLIEFSKHAEDDTLLDLIAGSAGLCGILVAAFNISGSADLLKAAEIRAELLIETHLDCAKGYGWPSRNSREPLTGFAHGAAGMGWALIHVGHHANRNDFIAAGLKAFEYERSLYSEMNQGWPDLRELPDQEVRGRYSSAWCHGGPGIGLSRATLPHPHRKVAEITDIQKAVEPMRTSPLYPTDCLCHGEIGNIELLITGAAPLAEAELLELARRRASGALLRRRTVGSWRSGAIPNVPVPGLLTGLAGIGYGLLRCCEPETFPGILSLEAPRLCRPC